MVATPTTVKDLLPQTASLKAGTHYSAVFVFSPKAGIPAGIDAQLEAIDCPAVEYQRSTDGAYPWVIYVFEPVRDIMAAQIALIGVSAGGAGGVSTYIPESESSLDAKEFIRSIKISASWMTAHWWVPLVIVAVFVLIGLWIWRR
ncbi:MAG: hypothetical protein A2Y72_03295 [Chloroflexi bacterium RBG_13_53_26]|nr:MAG: hypothetical protein A2Y72_03295 [Chloroflexi bacterium RBG_13_53_26]